MTEARATQSQAIDEVRIPRTSGQALRLVLRVTAEDEIEFVSQLVDEHDARISESVEFVGRRIHFSGSLRLQDILPKNELPVQEWRVADGTAGKFHVLMTWSLNRGEDVRPWYSLRVYRTGLPGSEVQPVFYDFLINPELKSFHVHDLDGDGTAEIIDIGREADYDVATVRRIEKSGTVSELQIEHAHMIQFLPPREPELGPTLRMGEEISRLNRQQPKCYRFKSLTWSKIHSRFVSP